ncbi:MAG: YceI family protein [Candidatus Competibacteraceae bacterium]|nr:YceI family protein [Candidatus Competibacteraceae bacterium]
MMLKHVTALRQIGLRLLLAVALATAANPLRAEPKPYVIDPEHFSVGFLVHHIGYAAVLGLFRKAEGSFVFDEDTGELSDLQIAVDAASVFTNHEKRDKHLRGEDFLDSDQHPQMTLTAKRGQFKKQRPTALEGQLTLRGVTRPIALQATWNKSDRYPIPISIADPFPYVLGASARGTLKRSDFGMSYAVDNGWVGDTVELIIEFEARRR